MSAPTNPTLTAAAAKKRYANAFRPSVPVRKDRKCSWKHHFSGKLREVVGYCENAASKNAHRFIWAGWDAIMKPHGKYARPTDTSRATGKRIRHCLRDDLHLISTPGEGVTQFGNSVPGFIMADHDSCCRLVGGICTVTMPEEMIPAPTIFSVRCEPPLSRDGATLEPPVSHLGAPVEPPWSHQSSKSEPANEPVSEPITEPPSEPVKSFQPPDNLEHASNSQSNLAGRLASGLAPNLTDNSARLAVLAVDPLDSLDPMRRFEPLTGVPSVTAADDRDDATADSFSCVGPSESQKQNQSADHGQDKPQTVCFARLWVRHQTGSQIENILLGDRLESLNGHGVCPADIDELIECIAPDWKSYYSAATEFTRDFNFHHDFVRAFRDVFQGFTDGEGKKEKPFASRKITSMNRYAFMIGIAKRFQLLSDYGHLPECWIRVANDYKRAADSEFETLSIERAERDAPANYSTAPGLFGPSRDENETEETK